MSDEERLEEIRKQVAYRRSQETAPGVCVVVPLRGEQITYRPDDDEFLLSLLDAAREELGKAKSRIADLERGPLAGAYEQCPACGGFGRVQDKNSTIGSSQCGRCWGSGITSNLRPLA